ncbi:MAG: PEP-CTERM sorting domain-containing protein [Pirellulales bacterium]|nr:PEP-CTERM sorting domain-containing protein [Pirellulales bacterium]
MRFMRVVLSTLVCAAVVACAGNLRADSIPALSFAAKGTTYNGLNYVVGACFSPNVDIVLTHLGVIDGDLNGMEDVDALVGLYEWNQPIIASATIPSTTTAESAGAVNAYYIDVEDVTLYAGHHYLVASHSADYFYLAPTSPDYTPAPDLTYGQFTVGSDTRYPGQAEPGGTPTALPTSWDTEWSPNSASPFFGGTFKYEAVPEPSALLLLLSGMLAAMWRRNR